MKMKLISRAALTGFALLLFAAGCGTDSIEFQQPEPDPEQPIPTPGKPDESISSNVGYLDLSSLVLGVTSDVETSVVAPEVPASQASTRADSAASLPEAADTYTVTITNQADQEVAWSGTYGELKALQSAEETARLELKAGRYTASAASTTEIPAVAWNQPEYAGSIEFEIVKRQTTTVDDLVCRLASIQTSVTLSADLKEFFKSDVTTTLSVGETSQVFTRDEKRMAYFRAVNENNDLVVTLAGEYNTSGDTSNPQWRAVTMKRTIPNVKAGQYRRISIKIQRADQGNVEFTLEVETWVYDQQIDVDVMSESYTFTEETIDDEDPTTPDQPGPEEPGPDQPGPEEPGPDEPSTSGPQIVSETFDFDMRYEISEGGTFPTAALDIVSETGITGFIVDILGGTVLPEEELGTISLTSHMDLITPATSDMEGMLKVLGFPTGDDVRGQTKLHFDISEFLEALVALPSAANGGDCDFQLTVTDASGTTVKKLMFKVVIK